MDEGILYGLMVFAATFDVLGFAGSLIKRSMFWVLFPFFGALVAWESYVQLGKDGQITVAYFSNGSTSTPITQDPGIMALVLGFLIILGFLLMLVIVLRRK